MVIKPTHVCRKKLSSAMYSSELNCHVLGGDDYRTCTRKYNTSYVKLETTSFTTLYNFNVFLAN